MTADTPDRGDYDDPMTGVLRRFCPKCGLGTERSERVGKFIGESFGRYGEHHRQVRTRCPSRRHPFDGHHDSGWQHMVFHPPRPMPAPAPPVLR